MTRKYVVIRHGEKPDEEGKNKGLDADGAETEGGLTVRGWQRAGALVRYFAPWLGRFQHPLLEAPAALFAVKPKASSQRALLTLQPLAQELGLDIDARFRSDEVARLAAAADEVEGAVLVCWRHSDMNDIARHLCPSLDPAPEWADDCFDEVWIFTPGDEEWELTRVAQRLLPGDRDR